MYLKGIPNICGPKNESQKRQILKYLAKANRANILDAVDIFYTLTGKGEWFLQITELVLNCCERIFRMLIWKINILKPLDGFQYAVDSL